jgi:hypothetical protein
LWVCGMLRSPFVDGLGEAVIVNQDRLRYVFLLATSLRVLIMLTGDREIPLLGDCRGLRERYDGNSRRIAPINQPNQNRPPHYQFSYLGLLH